MLLCFAVAYSDADIEIFSLEEQKRAYFIGGSEKKAAALGLSKDMALLKKLRPKYTHMCFIDPEKCARLSYNGGEYEYELLCVSSDCRAGHYLFSSSSGAESEEAEGLMM